MTVKLLTHDDTGLLEQVAAVLTEVSGDKTDPAWLSKMISDDRTFLFAAIADDGIITGYLLAYSFPYFPAGQYLAYLYDIEVKEAYRKTGIGKKMIVHALQVLKAKGVTERWLGTATDNLPAQRLFTATGATSSNETFLDFTYEL